LSERRPWRSTRRSTKARPQKMNSTAILDAFAILAWLQKEPGWQDVRRLFEQASAGHTNLLISAINLGEVYYRLCKLRERRTADKFLRSALGGGFPWQVVPASNERVWAAARIKAEYPVAYADAFAVALALEYGAELVTGDPEILALGRAGVVRVCWHPAGEG